MRKLRAITRCIGFIVVIGLIFYHLYARRDDNYTSRHERSDHLTSEYGTLSDDGSSIFNERAEEINEAAENLQRNSSDHKRHIIDRIHSMFSDVGGEQ